MIIFFALQSLDHWLALGCEDVSLDKGAVARSRRLLQTHGDLNRLCFFILLLFEIHKNIFDDDYVQFYGITSYQCMEMTPSMACANK